METSLPSLVYGGDTCFEMQLQAEVSQEESQLQPSIILASRGREGRAWYSNSGSAAFAGPQHGMGSLSFPREISGDKSLSCGGDAAISGRRRERARDGHPRGLPPPPGPPFAKFFVVTEPPLNE